MALNSGYWGGGVYVYSRVVGGSRGVGFRVSTFRPALRRDPRCTHQ